jgi:hypothetical protein
MKIKRSLRRWVFLSFAPLPSSYVPEEDEEGKERGKG